MLRPGGFRRARNVRREAFSVQKIIRKPLTPGVHLTCVQTDKFKTGTLSVLLLTALDADTASKNALLPSVLRRGTAFHPDMAQIDAALADLYGAEIVPLVQKKGEVQCLGFRAVFVDDDFLPPGTDVLERVASLLGEMLLMPNTRGGQLLAEYADGERENLAEEIRALVNDRQRYAAERLWARMCEGERYGVGRLGSLSAVKRITAHGLTRQYRQVLASAPAEVIYCGAADPERVERAVTYAMQALPRTGEFPLPQTQPGPVPASVRQFTEKKDVEQGQLAVGFRLERLPETERELAVLRVLNALYGGSVTSRLFQNVRERLSLCYDVVSAADAHKGVLAAFAGIDPGSRDAALAEILRQMDSLRDGEIGDAELTAAKLDVIRELRALADDPLRLADYCLDAALHGMLCAPEDLAALADTVGAEDAAAAARGMRTDAVYFLTGGGGNDR